MMALLDGKRCVTATVPPTGHHEGILRQAWRRARASSVASPPRHTETSDHQEATGRHEPRGAHVVGVAGAAGRRQRRFPPCGSEPGEPIRAQVVMAHVAYDGWREPLMGDYSAHDTSVGT